MRDVGDQRALTTGVVQGRNTAAPAAWADPAADGEHLDGVGKFVEVVDAMHTVRREERLPAGVIPGNRARVGADHFSTGWGSSNGQGDDGYVALQRPSQSSA